jgi:ribosomal subunit interface protein
MKIIIKAKNLDQSDALNAFIEKKFSSLKKFIDVLKTPEEKRTLAEVFVEVEKETKHHNKGEIFSCQLEIVLPQKSLTTKSNSDDLYKAIVAAKKAMEEEIKRYKFKNIEKNRREQRKLKTKLEK